MNKQQTPPVPALHEGRWLKNYLKTQNIDPDELARRLDRSPGSVKYYFGKPTFGGNLRRMLYEALDKPDQPIFKRLAQSNDETIHEGRRLRDYLLSRSISVQELAQRMNKSIRSAHSYLTMPRFKEQVREAILVALGLSEPDDLASWQDAGYQHGLQLRAYLRRHNISQAQLASKLNRSRSTVNHYLSADLLTPSVQESILLALEASYEQVFGTDYFLNAPTQQQAHVLIDWAIPLSLARNQLEQWQRLLAELRSAGAPAVQINFCQYQIWHLETSLSNLTLSDPL